MKKIKVIIFCCCLILLFSCNSDSSQVNLIPAKVTRVISGQTVEVVLTATSEVTKVRITGIDAPDLRQSPWGKAAQEKLSQLVMGLQITLETEILEQNNYGKLSTSGKLRDRFNRLNAHLWQDKILISQQLVKEGYVLPNTRYSHSYSKLLIDAQEYARLMGYGIWNPKQAMRYTPNQFRSLTKSK